MTHNPATLAALTVLSIIVLSCAILPLFWPHSSEETNLSLGASPPFAKILKLVPSKEGSERYITRERATRLIENGYEMIGGNKSNPSLDLTPWIWIEIPPILRTLDNAPVPPVLIPPDRVSLYFEKLGSILPKGLESLAGPPDQFAIQFTLHPTSIRYFLGTDELGRDLFVRILEGGRLSLAVGLAATLVSVIIGIIYGGIAGFCGGRIDNIMMRLVDILYALPFLIFVILLMVVFPRSLILLFVAIGAVEWLTTARIVRGEILGLRKLPFIDAAHCLGLANSRILFRHLIPNTIPPVIVYATLTVPTVILLESVLSFLGLGVQPPNSSWGILINEGADRMESYPWLLIYPSIFFGATLLSLNFLGDGLRDAVDPKNISG